MKRVLKSHLKTLWSDDFLQKRVKGFYMCELLHGIIKYTFCGLFNFSNISFMNWILCNTIYLINLNIFPRPISTFKYVWTFPTGHFHVLLSMFSMFRIKTLRKSYRAKRVRFFFQSPIQSVYIHSCIETKLCFLMLSANNMEKTMRDL